MRISWHGAATLALGFGLIPTAPIFAQNAEPKPIHGILARHGRLEDPAERRTAIRELREETTRRRNEAHKLAKAKRWPIRTVAPDGSVRELMAVEGDTPLYLATHNTAAAISTAVTPLHSAPFSLTGNGLTVGVWDGGAVRPDHQEFGGRVTVMDGGANGDHATHVGGTIIAAGVSSAAKGMAPLALVESYDWNDDIAEMLARGASYPEEPGMILLSNHSYGYVAGWTYTGLDSPKWIWYGNGSSSSDSDPNFGRYHSVTRNTDLLAHLLPYYLIVRSAGNDRADNPTLGDPVQLSPSDESVVTYDPALHPTGDAAYKGGYDTISYDAVAKNVLTIGSVSDAVNGGLRHLPSASVSVFSSYGPTDDGRIKPDLVANGEILFSPVSTSTSAYGNMSGTSMASPNATGSALLVVQRYGQLFPGHAMRASTLKGLLIHTADDLGNAGPDYRYGWGLINAQAAVNHLENYRSDPSKLGLIEDRLTTSRTSVVHDIVWDGISPIRATLSWTDPAGTATSINDDRTRRLVNDLDLEIVAPGGAVYRPFVMPHVGDWTSATFNSPATTGINTTDNVEQVLIDSPPAPGVYQVRVSHSNALSGGLQHFSLIISGAAGNDPAPAPDIVSLSPAIATLSQQILVVSGNHFLPGTTAKLVKTGESDVNLGHLEIAGDWIRSRIDSSGMAPGVWDLVVTLPDGQHKTMEGAFGVPEIRYQTDFEAGAGVWASVLLSGSPNEWNLTTNDSHSPNHAFFAPGLASAGSVALLSPSISIPEEAFGLKLTFWHRHGFQSGDGGVLEASINEGPWFDIAGSGSGATFTENAYNGTIPSNSQNPLKDRNVWSGTSAWKRTVVSFTDAEKYSGVSLRFRWLLGTNNSIASTGWFVDDVTLSGVFPIPANDPPVILSAVADPATVTGLSTSLQVSADDDHGEPALNYAWSQIDGPATATLSGEDTETCTATFLSAGDYVFRIIVSDAEGLTATEDVEVTVQTTPTTLVVSPTSASVEVSNQLAFTATVSDQFGNPIIPAPAIDWSVDGGGVIGTDGVFTAGPIPGGPFTITASSGALSAQGSLQVTGMTYETWQTAHFTPEEIAEGQADDLADPDGDGLSNLMEYALGSDPTEGNPSPFACEWRNDGPNGIFRVATFTRPAGLPGLDLIIEGNSDLQSPWTPITDYDSEIDGAWEIITVRIPDTEGQPRFLRFQVSRNED